MNLIPFRSLRFGAMSLNQYPISYDKSRISGSSNATYILHCKGGSMPGQKNIFTVNSSSKPKGDDNLNNNSIISAFKRENLIKEKNLTGQKYHKEAIDSYTFDKYYPNDDASLNLAIRASYRQVFGNLFPMESERPVDLERRLRNGDIPIREFIRELSKSTFYKANYLEVVTQQRCIELNFKHLLGRPPFNQIEIINHIELMNENGFDYLVDSLIDSKEYQEIFGDSTVPYMRCWDSGCSLRTSSFLHSAILERSFASSDNSIHNRKTLVSSEGARSQLCKIILGKSSQSLILS